MPQFRLVSAKEVVAQVIRGTGYKIPSVYHDDILEFIPEGISLIQVTRSLIKTYSGDIDCPGELLVKNYCVELPCGFISMLRMEDETGCRIREHGNVGSLKTKESDTDMWTRAAVFEVNPFVHQTQDGVPTTKPGSSVPVYGEDIERNTTPVNNHSFYQIVGNRIQTSFESGYIKIFYLALPVCKDGYPLIPDNANVKLALEWHVLRRLIGAGYQHPVFSWERANEQFDIYANRAMNEVSYPSLDDMAKAYQTNIRLIPPIGYSDMFQVDAMSRSQRW